MRRAGEVFGRRGGPRQLKEQIIIKRTSIAVIVLLICTISLFSTFNSTNPLSVPTEDEERAENQWTCIDRPYPMPTWIGLLFNMLIVCITSFPVQIGIDELWGTVASGGWRPSSAPRAEWPPPPNESNGYLCVRFNSDLLQQRTAICNAVLAARIMNATLVLPELEAHSWHDISGFQDIYDAEHFIESLRYDVRIVENLPKIHTHGKMKAYKINTPSYAPMNWYTTVALEKMKEHGAIYLTPISHSLEEQISNHEYQRLRCRVNYHALRFKPQLMKLSSMIVSKLRSQGPFLATHFEMDMIFHELLTPEQQKWQKLFDAILLVDYSESFDSNHSLTPEEMGLILHAMGFDNSTRIYLADAGFYGRELYMKGRERYMKPFRALFPHLEYHNTVIPANAELTENNTLGLLGSVVDYMVCLQADIFIPTYDWPGTFATNVMDHRLYNGFRTTIQPDRKALARIFIDREMKKKEDYAATEAEAEAAAGVGFEEVVRRVMFNTNRFDGPHDWERFGRDINPWPDCFCQISAAKNSSSADTCPQSTTRKC